MQIKTKCRFHLTLVRMAIFKANNNNCWWACDFYPVIKNNNMRFEDKWMQVEDMLSEVSKLRKTEAHVFSHIQDKSKR
jgi:uncharacterized membrane protein